MVGVFCRVEACSGVVSGAAGVPAVSRLVLDAVVLTVGFRQCRWGGVGCIGGARFGGGCDGLSSESVVGASASDELVGSALGAVSVVLVRCV